MQSGIESVLDIWIRTGICEGSMGMGVGTATGIGIAIEAEMNMICYHK